MAKKLTKRRVDAAKPGETVWDTEIPGFGLRVSKGGAKSYVLKYRRSGLQRWLTIGRHGAPYTPDQARKEARRLLGELAVGKDPAEERTKLRDAESLEVFADRYLDEYSKLHKKASTAHEDERLLKRLILPGRKKQPATKKSSAIDAVPALGKLRVAEIGHADIARFHRSLKDTPYLANRCLALLSHMFNVAYDWGVRGEAGNPCARVKRFQEKPRERFLSPKEMKRLGEALQKAEDSGESLFVTNAVRLLIFTGARLSEILTLKWEDVDLDARLLRLSDSKTGKKTVVLAPPAIDILANLPKQKNNPFVICGRNPGEHLVNLQKPWRRIRASAGLDDVRIHDLRHSFASVAVAGGMSLPLIGSLLGHSQAQTTQRYAHLSEDPRIAAADKVAETIAASMRSDGATVLKFK